MREEQTNPEESRTKPLRALELRGCVRCARERVVGAAGGGEGTNTGSAGNALDGGGSSYVELSATNVHFWRGWKNATDNGLVVFRW